MVIKKIDDLEKNILTMKLISEVRDEIIISINYKTQQVMDIVIPELLTQFKRLTVVFIKDVDVYIGADIHRLSKEELGLDYYFETTSPHKLKLPNLLPSQTTEFYKKLFDALVYQYRVHHKNEITKNDLFDAFSYYAFATVNNRPYNKEELKEEFEKWYEKRLKRISTNINQ